MYLYFVFNFTLLYSFWRMLYPYLINSILLDFKHNISNERLSKLMFTQNLNCSI